MKKAKKLIRNVLIVLVALVLIVALLINFFADSGVKKAIEVAGSKTLGVDVSVKKAGLSIMRGSLGLKDLAVDNPPGYKHEKLLELSEGDVVVEIRSLLSDTVNIKSVKLDGPVIVVEQKDLLKNNLNEVLKNIPSGDGGESDSSGKNVHIDLLEVTNAKAKVKLLPVPGKVDTLTLNLSTIRMTDIGGDKPVKTGAVISKVMLALAGGIAEQGAGLLPDEMFKALTSQLQNLGALPAALLDGTGKLLKATTDIGKGGLEAGADATKGVLDGVGEVGKGVTEGVGSVGKGVADGIKGILGGKKDQ